MALSAIVQPDASPPRVKLTTDGSSVTRTDAEGVTVSVRGEVVDGVIFDYEAPQEVPLTYEADSGGSVVVEMPDVDYWLIHLYRPELSVSLVMKSESDVAKPGRSSTVRTFSGRPFTVSSGSREEVSSELSVYALDEDSMHDLDAILYDQSVLFLSAPNNPARRDYLGPRYVRVQDVKVARVIDRSYDYVRALTFPYIIQDRPATVESGATGWDLMPTRWADMPTSWEGMPS